jgi:hypothetical protein
MATYEYEKVVADYASGKLTSEMAIGHSLQHIGKLYETIKANRHEWQTQIDALDQRVNFMQASVDRLTAFMVKLRPKRKANLSAGQTD